MNNLVQTSFTFDYALVSDENRLEACVNAEIINTSAKQLAEGMVELGKRLIRQQDLLMRENEGKHGLFEEWVEKGCILKRRNVFRYMAIARNYESLAQKVPTSALFPPSVIDELLSASDEVVMQVTANNHEPTVKEVREAKQSEREALEKARRAEERAKRIEEASQLALLQADDRINEAQGQLHSLEQQQQSNRAEIARLTGMIAELEATEPQVVKQEVQVIPPEVQSDLEATKQRVKELEAKQQALKAERDQKEERVKVLTNELRSYAEVDKQEKHNEQIRTKWRQACDAFHQGINQGFVRMVSPIDAQQAFEPDDWARLAELEATMKQALERLAYLRESVTNQFVDASMAYIEG